MDVKAFYTEPFADTVVWVELKGELLVHILNRDEQIFKNDSKMGHSWQFLPD